MYLNIDYIHSKKLSLQDIIILQLVRQQRVKNLEDVLAQYLEDESLSMFIEENYVHYIVGKKTDSEVSRLRLTKKGADLLDNAEIPEITEEDVITAEWLKNLYLKSDKEVGNFKSVKLNLALFRVNSGIEKNKLVYLCKSFIADESEWKFTNRLDYLFWKKEHMYNTKFDINSSRLYQYYLKNEDYFLEKFKTII